MMWTKEAHRAYSREYALSIRAGFDPGIARARAREAARTRKNGKQLHRIVSPKAEAKAERGPSRAALGIESVPHPVIPPELLADAERIKYLSHATIVGHLMGDPLPGRSALDKSRSGT